MLVYELANAEAELAIGELVSPVENAVSGNIAEDAPIVFFSEHLNALGVVFDNNLWC